jgi:hypothetical protein
MAIDFKKFIKGIVIGNDIDPSKKLQVEVTTSATTATKTTLQASQTANRTVVLPDASVTLTGTSDTATLPNKTINADNNTITNIDNNEIKANAAIDATKLADGSVSNAEFQFINTLSSNAQDQLDAKASSASLTAHTGASTGVHGVSGAVVGTTDSQTLTNKTLVVASNTITTAASGNLTSTELNAALDELQDDIDTRALNSDLTTHTGASTGVHGVIGAVVGTSDTQTLTNKTITFASNTLTGVQDKATLTTKGDLYVATASATVARQSVGSDGQVLTADSSQTNGVIWAVPSSSPTSSYELSNLGLAISVSSNALTIALKQADGTTDPGAGSASVKVGFSGPGLTNGGYVQGSVTGPLSLVISSGSTLGQLSLVKARQYIYLTNFLGTISLAISQKYYSETELMSTTAEGGAGGADSATLAYANSTVSNIPFRLIGIFDNAQPTAGLWTSTGVKLRVGSLSSLMSETVALSVSGSTTTAAGSRATVSWLNTLVDTHLAFSSNEFTVPISGLYTVNFCGRHDGTASVNQVSLFYLQVDGVDVRQAFKFVENTGVNSWQSNGTYTSYFSAGQIIRMQHETTIGTSPTINTNGSDVYMEIKQVK